MPALKPVLPDPGVRFQLVHHDDVATAMRAAVLGRGAPGVYNLAGPGDANDVRRSPTALGWYSVPMPELARSTRTAELVARTAVRACRGAVDRGLREPVLMDTAQGPPRAPLASPARAPARR